MLLSSPPVDKRGPHLTRMTPSLSPADAIASSDTSILSPRYRATTIGMVALVALHAFEALAVAAAMPTVAEALDGLRLYAPQSPLASGAADGRFVTATSGGTRGNASVMGTAFDLDGSTGVLSYDSPVLGVAQSTGTAAGQLIHTAGLLGILPDAGAAFQLGIRN